MTEAQKQYIRNTGFGFVTQQGMYTIVQDFNGRFLEISPSTVYIELVSYDHSRGCYR